MDIEWPWDRKERERREERHEREQLDRIERDERRILKEEQEIEQLEQEELKLLRRAQSATLVILDEKGEIIMANLVVGQSAESLYTEFSLPGGQGVAVPNAGPIAFASSDGAIATVDSATGHVVAVAAGTATITGSDAANGLNASDTVTVTGIQAQSATLVITPNNDAPSSTPAIPGAPVTPTSFRK